MLTRYLSLIQFIFPAKIYMVPIAAFRNVSNLINIGGFEGMRLEILIINYTYHKENSL